MKKIKDWWYSITTIFNITFDISLDGIYIKINFFNKGFGILLEHNLLKSINDYLDTYKIIGKIYNFNKIKKYIDYCLEYSLKFDTGFKLSYEVHDHFPGLNFDMKLLGLCFTSEFRDTRLYDSFDRKLYEK